MSQPGRSRVQWLLTLAAVLWMLALIAAPYGRVLVRGPLRAVSATVYAAGSVICHQRPERSFHTAEVPWPVCARCAGLYAGAACGALLALIATPSGWRRLVTRARLLLAMAALPTGVTLLVEWIAGGTPSNGVRALAGAPLGAAIAWVLVVATATSPVVEVH